MTTRELLLRRVRSAAPWALRHVILSIVIAVSVAWLVIGAWFPAPFAEISGGLSIFLLIIAVDVVCGPVLTLLILHPAKSRTALGFDIVVIAAIQFSALGYGLYTLSEARPLAIIFEVDRFRVVSYADLDTSVPGGIPAWVNRWGFEAPRQLGVRTARTTREKFASVYASLQGVEPGQRPDWWQDYNVSAPEVKQRAKKLEFLLKMHPKDAHQIQSAAMYAASGAGGEEALRKEDLLWLPVVSRRTMDWVAFIDPRNARIRGYMHLDGFGN